MRYRKFALLLSVLCLLFSGTVPGSSGTILAVSAGGLALSGGGALLRGGPIRFWIFPAIFFLITPFLSAGGDISIFGLSYSFKVMRSNLMMLAHAYLLMAAINRTSAVFSAGELVGAASTLGMRSAGIRAAIFIGVMRRLRDMISETHYNYSLTRRGRFEYATGLPVFFFAVARNSARIAGDISSLFYLRNISI